MSSPDSMSLLEKTQKLIEVERSLTSTLQRVEPWLPHNTTNPLSWQAFEKRVRPIPNSMEEVEQILAVARSYSSRTSAPAGWNPAAPVVGFSTPNPLPHQLRGGALASLELERARQEERNKKRKRQVEEEAKTKKAAEEKSKKSDETKQLLQEKELSASTRPTSAKKSQEASSTPVAPRRSSAARPTPQVLQTTMNLSDSSSEEEDSGED